MTIPTITIPNIEVKLTVEQLIAAVYQLEHEERAEFMKALAKTGLDRELSELIAELNSQPPADEISDDEILAEIQAVRQ